MVHLCGREARYGTTAIVLQQDEDLVVTWKSLKAEYGIDILDSKTEDTRNVFLEDHDHQSISNCKFVGDGKVLVCCSRSDNFLRLFNVQSGDLLSVLDIREEPFSLEPVLASLLSPLGCWEPD